MPRVSILTAAYNSERFIGETIRSVHAQTYPDWEHIVVDDGSTDNTRAVVAPFENRIRFLHQPNKGQGAARNLAYSVSTGEYIAVLDSDDVWEPDKLEKQVRALDEASRAGLVYTGARTIDERGNFLSRPYPPVDISHDPLLGLLVKGNPICYSSVMFNRRFLAKHSLQDETIRHADELLTHLTVALRAGKFLCLPENLTRYRVHSRSLAQSEGSREYRDGALQAIEQFFGLYNVPEKYRKYRHNAIARIHYVVAQRAIDRREDPADAVRNLFTAIAYDPKLSLKVLTQLAELVYRLGTRRRKAIS